jgi:hypothetical protein
MRNLIIFGNCQAGALLFLARQMPEIADNWHICYHEIWPDAERLKQYTSELKDADILLLQDIGEWRTHPLRDSIPNHVRVIRYPLLYVGALWPLDAYLFGDDDEMVKIKAAHPASDGEFLFGFRDGLLARLREETPNPEERYRRYLKLDYPGVPDIARCAEYEEARLLRDDRRLGYEIGKFIVGHYRTERLFHAIVHPAAPLVEVMAQQVFRKAGLVTDTERIPPFEDYFGRIQVPVHPQVIQTLGLRWVDEASEYNVADRKYTFEQYVRGYISCA